MVDRVRIGKVRVESLLGGSEQTPYALVEKDSFVVAEVGPVRYYDTWSLNNIAATQYPRSIHQ